MNSNIRIYGYLRASTDDQDASRAKNDLIDFAHKMGFPIACWFEENESGAQLHRPELFRLLDVAMAGDIILIEQVDRISRLNSKDWEQLKSIIANKGLKVVALDLPTSHQFMNSADEFTDRMLAALNNMMLDMLAAVARKDYEDRRRHQAQGVQKAKQEGKYKGRPINKLLHQKIEGLLREKKSYSQIEALIGCSRHTIAKVSKQMKLGVT
ncbi:resolvase [Vibrio parahaemolyticus]|uniref:recombinase family protein n=1 Tax=Vibrio parahaemolyticus TaxID=670 RepID=UPI000C86CA78|nr:recombinase family protein [Vibrio parahaemolyticus]PMS39366.1 resolvase [Vibrio parahaemolyticus]PMS58350.1 resolvase [Vibrio parahaemolyticus]PMS65215.1 resolvase [Vibrio parahaemolyticus]PMS70717.1 resolvase [Vibrio parahaemolyticus]PMS74617.1 resolvase [Vibrio parahaemolyticus]